MRHMKLVAILGVLAVLAFVMMPTLRADDAATGSVSGTVVDASGAAVSGAKVSVFGPKPTDGSKPVAVGTGTTDDKGAYSIKSLPPATYTVAASVKEKKLRGMAKDVVVEAAKETKVDPITVKEGHKKN